jgi:hypothetical protein
MLALSTQVLAVGLIVAAALGYLLVIARRSWKSGHGAACGGCHNSAEADFEEALPGAGVEAGRSAVHQMFLPVENLTDVARRRRAEKGPMPPAHPDVKSGEYQTVPSAAADTEKPQESRS